MGNCTTSVHVMNNEMIASRFSQDSIVSQCIQSEGTYVFPSALKLLIGFLILVTATMDLNAVVISPSTTVLVVSPSGSVSARDMVTLTATVTDSGAVSSGFVNFCDATRSTCLSGDGLYGTAQLTRSGTATLRMRFPTGNNSIVAMFIPTKSDLGSRSPYLSINVGSAEVYPSMTSLTASGGPGNYTLSGEVVGFGRQAMNGVIDLLNITANNSQIGATSLSGPGFKFAAPASNTTGFSRPMSRSRISTAMVFLIW
jgi:hypothetical protein